MSSNLGDWPGNWSYISSLTVAGRFWSRRISRFGTHVDDWLALDTLIVNHALNATVLIAVLQDGLGFNTKRFVQADPAVASEQKLIFIGTVLYGAGSTSIRLAVIIFFFRIINSLDILREGQEVFRMVKDLVAP
ncbi:hypothetical protein F4678DRAFT_462303 [Xylaria arbuscula]|nr:hypothetical protein F4678DRAFT_462303 [Xylaria arbuscula]